MWQPPVPRHLLSCLPSWPRLLYLLSSRIMSPLLTYSHFFSTLRTPGPAPCGNYPSLATCTLLVQPLSYLSHSHLPIISPPCMYQGRLHVATAWPWPHALFSFAFYFACSHIVALPDFTTLRLPGPATCGNCPSLATCTLVSSTRKAPYCVCPPGFGMAPTGCVRGALPTVSFASLTFYNQRGYALTPYTYTMRVRYSGCTNLPSMIGLNVCSYWQVDQAPGGAGGCQAVNVYRYANCVTLVVQLPYLSLASIAATGVS
ncbi:unnamed protein product [Closterium sp. NIES-64]|nr:unnamed protein product [Closterium sp. NIES-64]